MADAPVELNAVVFSGETTWQYTSSSFEQPSNALEPNDCKVVGNVTLLRLLQEENAEEPMDVAAGRLMVVRLLQYSNAEEPIDVAAGRLTLVRLLQEENAEEPIDIAAGRLMVVRLLQEENA